MNTPTGTPAVEAGPGLVRIPTDVEREERVWGPLTLRQAAALALTAGGLYAVWWATRGWLPTLVFLPAAAVVAALVLVVVTARRDGQSLDRWLGAALAHRAATRTLTHPITGQAPGWLAAHAVPLDTPQRSATAAAGIAGEPLRAPRRPPLLPPRAATAAGTAAVATAGIVDLGPDGYAVLAVADPVDLGLRTPTEQLALLAGWAGVLHALTAGVQILIRAVPLDVAQDADHLAATAEQLPHPALAAAARDHAAFLHALGAHHELLRRQVIVILREPHPTTTTPTTTAGSRWPRPRPRARRRAVVGGGAEGAAHRRPAVSGAAVHAAHARLARRLGEIVDLAAPAGITLHPLPPTHAAAVLAAACHPGRGVLAGHLAHPEHVITGPTTPTRTPVAPAGVRVGRGQR